MNLSLILRTTVRRWRRTPLLTLGILCVLSLGIGVVGQSFGSLDAMLLRPLPFADEARLDLSATPRDARTLGVVARLRAGWSAEAAWADLKAIASQLSSRHLDPSQPAVYVLVAILVAAVFVPGGLLPARRASRTSALSLLRT
jgi:hypothetical protein